MDNILRPRSRGSRGGVSPTRDGAVAMAPSFSRLQQKRDPESNQHRYYILDLQPYLFGVWTLIGEWGRKRHLGQMMVELCGTREEAERVFGTKLREKRRCRHT